MTDLVDGAVYQIHSRNLVVGIWQEARKSFLGIREKFGHHFLFAEYHYDIGAPLGTAREVRRLNISVPDGMEIAERNEALQKWLEPVTREVMAQLWAADQLEEERLRRWRQDHPMASQGDHFRSRARLRGYAKRQGFHSTVLERWNHGFIKHQRDQMRYHEKRAVKEYKMAQEATYRIVRFYQEHDSEVIKTGLSLEDARAHCNDPETSSTTASAETLRRAKSGEWFDGYEAE